jgi:hypothetical protein
MPIWLALSLAAAAVNANPPAVTGPGASAQIALPRDGDDYSRLVARAAAGDKSVDFRALRMAHLKSVSYKKGKEDVDALRTSLFGSVKAGENTAVRDAAIKLLSADYTDLYGHKFLRQSCEQLGDTICAQQEHFAEFGLLLSITQSGDGKTCKTGWEVAAIKEEYFVLAMLNTKPKQQALVEHCDLMSVVDENGAPADYYFRIDAVMEDEESMFK